MVHFEKCTIKIGIQLLAFQHFTHQEKIKGYQNIYNRWMYDESLEITVIQT